MEAVMLKLLGRIALAVALQCAGLVTAKADGPVIFFAAASLKDALGNAGKTFTAQTGIDIIFFFDASSSLAREIEEGAPADLFASADLDWMDYLAKRNLIDLSTRVNLLGNRLVVVAPKDAALTELKFDETSFETALGGGRIATGAVETVPVGRYAKLALEKLGLWTALSSRIAPADNVRVALAYVARGEAPLGIVYATDAAAEPKVKVVATIPRGSYPPIVYPFAVTVSAKGDDAKRFLSFLQGPAARAIFTAQGFSTVELP
jgi:molybdate transport system substrate-binding protein